MNRDRRYIKAVLALIAAGLIYYGMTQKQASGPSTLKQTPAQPVLTPISVPSATPPVVPSPNDAAAAENPIDPPTLRQAREEVGQDPHRTPPSLVRFAQELARKEDLAKGSPAVAESLFSDLERCMQPRSEAVPPQAQVVCVTTAEELSQRDPDRFQDRSARLEQSASDEVKRLLSALKRFQ